MGAVDTEVLENAIHYHGLLKAMRRYVTAFNKHLNEEVLNEGVPFCAPLTDVVERFRADHALIAGLGFRGHILEAVDTAHNYAALEQHFSRPLFGERVSAEIRTMDNLAYFIDKIAALDGTGTWVGRNDYHRLQAKLEERLLPLFQKELELLVKSVAIKFNRDINNIGNGPTMNIIPVFQIGLPGSNSCEGVLYLLQYIYPNSKEHKVYFDTGSQRQIALDDITRVYANTEADFKSALYPETEFTIHTPMSEEIFSSLRTLNEALEKVHPEAA